MNIMHKPLHPGEIVKDALFEETTLTVTDVSRALKVNRSTLSQLLNKHSGISPDMEFRLALFLETSPEMWLNIQKDYDLWCAKKRTKNLKITPLKKLRKAAPFAKPLGKYIA